MTAISPIPIYHFTGTGHAADYKISGPEIFRYEFFLYLQILISDYVITALHKTGNRMKFNLIMATALILLCSCLNTRQFADTLNSPRVHFGKRGGFTNIPLEYVLIEKGQLYKLENDSLLKISKVASSRIDHINGLISNTGFRDLKINDPGNITYFIRVVTSDYDNEVLWHDSSKMQGLSMIYNALMETTQKEKNDD